LSLDELLELSDEEVLGYSLSGESALAEEDEDEEEDEERSVARISKGADSESVASAHAPEDEERGGWGTSKRDYYNADAIETEADALEEEAEARKIQQKRLQALTEADFGFDEEEWQEAGKDVYLEDQDEGRGVVKEVLPQLEITPAMTEGERMKILRTRYPEFEPLAKEYTNLQPLYQQIALEAQRASTAIPLHFKAPNPTPTAIIKYQSLSTYLGVLSMYFALLTSPAQSSNGTAAALSASELRDHPIMESLIRSRELWNKVKDLYVPEPSPVHLPSPSPSPPSPNSLIKGHNSTTGNHPPTKKLNKYTRTLLAEQASKAAEKASQIKAHNASLEALTTSLASRRPSSAPSGKLSLPAPLDVSNDYTDETTLPEHLLAAKAAKKKSLRFYTSQITQKASRRKEAGAQAGGDVDLPHKERFRDRVARLNAEAEKRGKSQRRDSNANLGGLDEDEDEDETPNNARVSRTQNGQDGEVEGEEQDYYTHITSLTASKRTARTSALKAAHAASKAAAYIPPEDSSQAATAGGGINSSQKRAITYAIEKNKGLAPHRKKDVRNPRVKKRNKYESKMKKLSSVRAVFRGGEERGGYQGEATGIKRNLVKSVKL
jgi:U3 small nucleolar RNA-associated protein 3